MANATDCLVTEVEDVLITDELGSRPSRKPDYEAESRALGLLAQEIATNPRGVLHHCAELVRELCHADSAGISTLEPGGTSGMLRWHAATGEFASNLDRAIPREESPCGTVMERDCVLLFKEAERFFPALRGAEPRIYENLLAPWHVDGKAVGTLWAIKHTPEGQFDAEDARVLVSLARLAAAAFQMTSALDEARAERLQLEQSATALQKAEARLKILVSELQHRTQNLLSVVGSVADQTARSSNDFAEFRIRFRDRLGGLSRVQRLLSQGNEFDEVPFDDLLETELAAMGAGTDQVRLDGPKGVRLRSSSVQTLAMALHELATNAVKYGALAQPDAKLSVTWHVQVNSEENEPWLHIDWRESGVRMPPSGSKPSGGGQGRELIEKALPYGLGAITSFELGPDGAHCTIAIPVLAAVDSMAGAEQARTTNS